MLRLISDRDGSSAVCASFTVYLSPQFRCAGICICIFFLPCAPGGLESLRALIPFLQRHSKEFSQNASDLFMFQFQLSGGILHVRVALCYKLNTFKPHKNLHDARFHLFSYCCIVYIHFSSANHSCSNFCGLAKIYAPPSTTLHPSFEWKVISLLYYNGKSTYLPRRLHSRQQEAWHSPKLILLVFTLVCGDFFAWNTV